MSGVEGQNVRNRLRLRRLLLGNLTTLTPNQKALSTVGLGLRLWLGLLLLHRCGNRYCNLDSGLTALKQWHRSLLRFVAYESDHLFRGKGSL